MRKAEDTTKTQSLPRNKGGLDRAVVSMMEQFPVDRKAELPMRVDVNLIKNCAKQLYSMGSRKSSRAASKGEDRALPHGIGTATATASPLPTSVVYCGSPTHAFVTGSRQGRRGKEQKSNPALQFRPDLEEKIKAETVRRAHLMVEQQLRLCLAEMESQRWKAASDAIASRRQREGEEESNITMSDVNAGALSSNVDASGTDNHDAGIYVNTSPPPAQENTSVVPLASIRALRGVNWKGPQLNDDNNTDDDPERRRQLMQGGKLRVLLERTQDYADAKERNMEQSFSALHGNSMGRKIRIPATKRRCLPEFALTLSGELPSTEDSNSGGDNVATAGVGSKGDDIVIQRLIGIPNHNRGLYAGLRSAWIKASKAKAFARMLFRNRAHTSAWWKLVGSREGMIAAAQASGLDPDVYEKLMTRWMEGGQGADSALKHMLFPLGGAGAAGPLYSALLNSQGGGAGSLASLLFSGDENLMNMSELAHQLGRLQMSGVLTPEEIARIVESGDENKIREELVRILGSDAVKQQAARLLSGSNIGSGGDVSFHELAKALLHEKRRAAMEAMQRGESGSASGKRGNRFSSKSYLSSLLQGSLSTSATGPFFPSLVRSGHRSILSLLSSEEARAFWASMSQEEGQAFLASMSKKEREAFWDSINEEGRKAIWDSMTREEQKAFRDAMTKEDREAFWNTMSEEDRQILWNSMSVDEQQAMREAVASGSLSSTRVGSPDPFSLLPPLGVADDGEADRRRSKHGGRHGHGKSLSADMKYPPGTPELCSLSDKDPLNATQAPKGSRGTYLGRNPSDTVFLPFMPDGVNDKEYTGPDWWKQQNRRPPCGQKGIWSPSDKSEMGSYASNKSTEGMDLIDLLKTPRAERRKRRSFKRANWGDSGADKSGTGSPSKSQFSPHWSVGNEEFFPLRDRPKKVTRFVYDGKPRNEEDPFLVSTTNTTRRTTKPSIPPFVRKPKPNVVAPMLKVEDDDSDNDSESLSSLFANDDEDLTLFLATFPEELQHVRLRNEARGVLGELKEVSSFLVNYATNLRHRRPEGYLAVAHRESFSSTTTNEQVEEQLKTRVNLEELHQRFEMEGREEHSELWHKLQELRKKVLEQEEFLKVSLMDVHNLSCPLPGEDRDAFAMRLTKEVNAYSKTHRLDRRELGKEAKTKEDYDAAVRTYLESFALTRGRRPGRDVGCQCKPEDLGYVDKDIRRTEEEMEDLYFHARGLFSAIKLTIIGVGNVMGFHASLELESTCKHCFCIFEAPRTLWPCGHTFCQQCLIFMFTEQGDLICDECGSLCEIGYTPNLALELVASYQVLQRTDYDDEEIEDEEIGNVKQRTIEGVLGAMLRDLISTQTTIAEAPRKTGTRSRVVSFSATPPPNPANPPVEPVT